MYAHPGIQFRDPFVSHSASSHSQSKPSWPFYQPRQRRTTLSPPLTPAPEMNAGPYSNTKAPSHQHEGDYQNGSYASTQQPWRSALAPYHNQDIVHADYARNGTHTGPPSRSFSPVFQPQHRQSSVDDGQQSAMQKRASIAVSFQIPKSVNDSGGSLAELAAQIEDSVIPLQPARPLVADAKPTTGFRKWVTTILSTTMVAQNVVILALLFIYRLKKLNPSVQGKPGSEYRLLTVALMLGNKFLDDNTYTNRTWAEVSGINVSEVHIMEVEFLSNMKYNLFTTADDWTQWQSLLGKFAAYFERANKPQPPPPQLAPILPPTSSLNLPMALPSPPSSNQASPPYLADLGPNLAPAVFAGPSPAPSPHVYMPSDVVTRSNPRKRSYDERSVEPPAKRMATYSDYPLNSQLQPIPRLPLPNSTIPPYQSSGSNAALTNRQLHQLLPPLNVPARAMAMVYPSATSQASLPQVQAMPGSSQSQSQMGSQYASRQQSPFPGSGTASPASALSHSAAALQPAIEVSPKYYLQHRNSPYRPVQNVSKLLYPPPTSALQQQAPSIDSTQMYYQPLGKPQQRQPGRLPYVLQNMWLDGNLPETMTPVSQWPSFLNTHHQQQQQQQQPLVTQQ